MDEGEKACCAVGVLPVEVCVESLERRGILCPLIYWACRAGLAQ